MERPNESKQLMSDEQHMERERTDKKWYCYTAYGVIIRWLTVLGVWFASTETWRFYLAEYCYTIRLYRHTTQSHMISLDSH